VNWAPFDAVIDAATARGLRVYATLGYTPAWASTGNRKGDGAHIQKPAYAYLKERLAASPPGGDGGRGPGGPGMSTDAGPGAGAGDAGLDGDDSTTPTGCGCRSVQSVQSVQSTGGAELLVGFGVLGLVLGLVLRRRRCLR
jgi:hypothetical protein